MRKWNTWFGAALSTLAIAAIAPPAGAIRGNDGTRSKEVLLPTREAARDLTPALRPIDARHASAWNGFRSRYGDWRGSWRDPGAAPHSAYGPGIPLAGFAPESGAIDAAVRRFIRSHPGVFGAAPELRTLTVRQIGRIWQARYEPQIGGIPVRFVDWEFEIGADGRLFAFGAGTIEPARTPARSPNLLPAVAKAAARSGLEFDPATDRVEGGERLAYVPVPAGDGTEYRLAYEVRVRTERPRADWTTLVDAEDGAVLWRQNRVRETISGTVSGLVHPLLPTDPLTSKPFRSHTVVVGPTNAVTDTSGLYAAAATGTVTVSAQLRGLFADVVRADAVRASFSTPANNPSTVNIPWSNLNSHDAERDGFYHVNAVHAYVKRLDPTFTGLDYPMSCEVNRLDDVCNAFWDGTGVHFFAAGGGCPNMATLPDVIYHEYGHGVNDFVYIAGGSFGMGNGALHEGMADVNAAFLQDSPDVGKGFFGPGTVLRRLVNTNRWPDNASGDPHETGLIIGGSFWDLRQSLGLATAEHLAHFAKYLLPDDGNDGVAMAEFFQKTLMVDDDDSNLGNGTPHAAQIAAAFNGHGIGTGYSIQISHTPVADQPRGQLVPIVATITYSGPIGALNPSGAEVHYALNSGAFTTIKMTAGGAPNQFRALIPAPDGAVVRYYISATDTYGGQNVSPAGAPLRTTNVFIVGGFTTFLNHQMETDPGWTVGAPGDAATTGVWIRANPNGTLAAGGGYCQPEEDHTPLSGLVCFVTGNGSITGPIGEADVDGGRTTLTTATFDGTGGGTIYSPLIEYYRWYTNDQGSAPGIDVWRVDISNNNGATWVPVENTNAGRLDWVRIVFRIQDYVTPTTLMKMRFIAADEGDGSIVEALVDDFRLLGFTGPLSVSDAPVAAGLRLAPPSPNPFANRTLFEFSLPTSSRVTLRLVDVAGRTVRTLADESFGAGRHNAAWDGRDDEGRAVPSGIYFARLESGAGNAVQRVMRLQ